MSFNKSNIIRFGRISLFLCLFICILLVHSAMAFAAPSAKIKQKDEEVYASLSNSGPVKNIYLVNHFELSKTGIFKDYGESIKVKNLSNNSPISKNGAAILLKSESKNFYYQGDMKSRSLPWNFEISYYLDEEVISSDDLLNASGDLEIEINTSKNQKVNPNFYNNYMLQISIPLKAELCTDIKTKDGIIANAGGNKMITYTVMPKKNANLSLQTTVKNFEMDAITITAIPFSMNVDLPDTSGMLGELNQLPAAISELNKGAEGINDGSKELSDAANSLAKSSEDIDSGLNTLSENSSSIIAGSAEINSSLSSLSSGFDTTLQSILQQIGPNDPRYPAIEQLLAGL
ncbi:MAG: hypothetical protein ACRCUS_07920, partial [Anaerovoracaceae bacterium]